MSFGEVREGVEADACVEPSIHLEKQESGPSSVHGHPSGFAVNTMDFLEWVALGGGA